MTKITFTSVETFEGEENTYIHTNTVGSLWSDQVECFYEFLVGQGFIITHDRFIEYFGGLVESREINDTEEKHLSLALP